MQMCDGLICLKRSQLFCKQIILIFTTTTEKEPTGTDGTFPLLDPHLLPFVHMRHRLLGCKAFFLQENREREQRRCQDRSKPKVYPEQMANEKCLLIESEQGKRWAFPQSPIPALLQCAV